MNNEGFIPEHGGFKEPKSYKKTLVIYDATMAFCKRFHRRHHRQFEQMEQAARSGKQNTIEGSLASTTSKKSEVHLINVAKASLGELLEDYKDFLRTRDLPLCDKTQPEARQITQHAHAKEENDADYRDTIEHGSLEIAANTIRHHILQANYLLGRQIQRLAADFLKQRGIRQRMTAARERAKDASSPSVESPPPTRACPACEANIVQRTTRHGTNARNAWGCSKYPDAKQTRPVEEDREKKVGKKDQKGTGDRVKPLLLGNSFPLTLIRRPTRIVPTTLQQLRAAAQQRQIASFWGHTNTLAAAEAILGFSPAPTTERPVLTLSSDNLPVLDGITFTEAWILSPDYVDHFRPAVGEEVPAGKIKSWQILTITWENA